MNDESFKIFSKRMNNFLSSFDYSSPYMQEMFLRITLKLQTNIKLNIKKQKLIDQGNLINKVNYNLSSATQGFVNLSIDAIYAAIHEYGGTIRPVKRKWLTIPASKKYRRVNPRDLNLTFIQTERVKAYLIDKKSNQIAYILRKLVNIPARPYLRPGIIDTMNDAIRITKETIDQMAKDTLND